MVQRAPILTATRGLLALTLSALVAGCVGVGGTSPKTEPGRDAGPPLATAGVAPLTRPVRAGRSPVVLTGAWSARGAPRPANAVPGGFDDPGLLTRGEPDTPPRGPAEDEPTDPDPLGPGALVPASPDDNPPAPPDRADRPGATPAPGPDDPEMSGPEDETGPEDDDDAPSDVAPKRLAQAPRVGPDRPGRGNAMEGGDEGEDQEDTDLGRSRAGRRGEGGGPTRSEEESDNEEDEFKSDLLQKALGLEDSPIGVFGWLQGSFTGNPANPRSGHNFGVFPNTYANTWLFQQLWFTVEKRIDLERADEYQLGFRLDNLTGSDWDQYGMVGLFDGAFTSRYFGYDPVQFYGEVHLPWFTEGGLDVKGGRFFTLPGYEDAAAPGRPLNSTSYLFTFAQPFTTFGVMTTLHLTDRLNLFNGAVNGWDRFIDRNYRWGYAGGLVWDSPDDRTNVTLTFDVSPNQFPYFFKANYRFPPDGVTPPGYLPGRRNPLYDRDEAFLASAVVIHKATEEWTLVAETELGYEANVLGFRRDGTPVNAEWYGLAWFSLYEFSERLTGVYRGDVFRDQNGVRSGYDDTYFEQTLGLIIKPKTWLWFRPEVRWDWASGEPPYDDGRSNRQFTFGFDTIFLF